ncbi:Reverse transcriptase RNA-dependent DNA polymerase [Metschnikowia aff. pulcherrima]|uniref:Reverse transcriptase RNA-dependent DNA polymerase n=1 Tax=Metschnikowia aff. pulcherrima TaxID=2163413 RepID=A0A4P6XG21_9ASCO|nr:Reverse transcriptase RNA-dependent DNA polymerase [Metschnikowia aff. pulcherrima]
MDPLNANGTLVPMQQDVRPTNCRWVFAWKDDGRSKAELVAKGFVQVPGVTKLIPGD